MEWHSINEIMDYKQIDSTYRDDVIAEAMYSREMEHFHYDFDRINFEFLLLELPDGEYRNEVKDRLATTIMQMGRVEQIHAALKSQITDQTAHDAAVARAIEKRRANVDK